MCKKIIPHYSKPFDRRLSAVFNSLFFQIRKLNLIGGPAILQFQRLKCFLCEFAFECDHANLCVVAMRLISTGVSCLGYTEPCPFALVAYCKTSTDNNCVIVKPKPGSHAVLHMCLVSKHISVDLLISITAQNGFFHEGKLLQFNIKKTTQKGQKIFAHVNI